MKSIFYIFILILMNIGVSFAEGESSSNINIKYIELEKSKFYGKENAKTDVQVLYFFSYGCPYCYDFENYTQHLIRNKDENVSFKHIPISVIPSWNEYTKAFHIAKSLKIDIRTDIFKKVHLENEKILSKEQLSNYFFDKFNISYEEFNKRYESSFINYKIKKEDKLADLYELTGTPSIVVIYKDGRTFKTSPSISGGIRDTMASTIYLIRNANK